ncbi:MAG TPA: hypothetical protein VGZ52_00755 [Acidimicrobiales bacterium]|nr:hypothetical protein [Acidimicrobiales bacterium]
MQTRRWVDPSQPQTLQIAVFLLYAQAVLLLLFGAFLSPLGLALIAGGIGAGYGIANERKWGYGLGLLVALFPFIFRVAYDGLNYVFSTDLISLMFEVALVVLLLHPQSREYERIWFK